MILQLKPPPCFTVKVVYIFGASPHHNSFGCGKNSKGGLREKYMFDIVHSPRISLLAPLKLVFGIGTIDQSSRPCLLTRWSSRPTVLVETGQLSYSFNSAVSWSAMVLCFWMQPGFPLRPQLLQLDVVLLLDGLLTDITLDTVALDDHKDLLSWWTDGPARRFVNNLSSFKLWYVTNNAVCIAIL